jgi:hypothetical protein
MSSHCEKWGFKVEESKDLYVVLFISRNKDNKDVENFKERRKSFITTKTPEELNNTFKHFVEDGVDGEMCRFYYSVNSRDATKVKKQLLHFLIDEDFNLTHLDGKLASIAAKKECAKTKHWMFDFDSDDKIKVSEFLTDISKCVTEPLKTEIRKTPHGYAIITERGFDTRQLGLEDKWWNIATLKKDDLLCYTWERKDEI